MIGTCNGLYPFLHSMEALKNHFECVVNVTDIVIPIYSRLNQELDVAKFHILWEMIFHFRFSSSSLVNFLFVGVFVVVNFYLLKWFDGFHTRLPKYYVKFYISLGKNLMN